MIKIRNSLKRGLKAGNKNYFSILISYLPIYILSILLIGINFYIPKIKWIRATYMVIGLLIYILFRTGILGVHYQLLSPDIKHIHFWQGIFKPYKLHLFIQNIIMGFYKYLIGFIYILLPNIVVMASIKTGAIYSLWMYLWILYIPMFIKLFYSYGFSQLFIYNQIIKGHYQTCGILLHDNKILMQGNKLKYLLCQIILIIPRLLLAIIIFAISQIWIKVILIRVLIAILTYMLITWILMPYIISSKLEFYKQIK